jgi:hypothetical protein
MSVFHASTVVEERKCLLRYKKQSVSLLVTDLVQAHAEEVSLVGYCTVKLSCYFLNAMLLIFVLKDFFPLWHYILTGSGSTRLISRKTLPCLYVNQVIDGNFL